MALQDNSQLYLSPDQQDLLMAALSSNQSPPNSTSSRSGSRSQPRNSMSARDLYDANQNGQLDFSADDSPYLGFDLDGDNDDGFEFDANGDLIDDDADDNNARGLHDKRKSIEGQDEDDEGGGKRREGDDKSGKKPGRKPLTSEPTSKRKAQNRAAQRAFRERKEKHLKDLETKVEDLEKTSESTSHENGLLRAQVERLQVELKEYRKRLSWVSSNGLNKPQQQSSAYITQARNTNAFNNNDFQFEFPKFGDLPAVPSLSNGNLQKQAGSPSRSSTLPVSKAVKPAQGAVARNSMSSSSPRGQAPTMGSTGNSPMNYGYSTSPVAQNLPMNGHNSSIDSLNGLFSPSILAASRNYGYFSQQNIAINQGSRRSIDNGVSNSMQSIYASSSNTDSPASSSDSHQQTSSMGTSPEPSLNSPGSKHNDYALNTIAEDQIPNTLGGELDFCKRLSLACGSSVNPVPPIMAMSNFDSSGNAITPGFDPNGINWLAQQNGGTFDPILFGDYRESQDAVVSQDFGTFFNDAFPLPDLGSPLHNFNELAPEPTSKVDLMKQVEAAREGEEEVVPGEDRAKLMTCNKIWDRLQSMEKFRNGEIDVDNLCSELRAKARCSEGGAVVNENDVNKILGMAK